ncbi:MAG: dTMP kinase [Dehalococcoidia bacterium]|nr:dTMP kinase [Dehalococcoidia bacterium]MQG16570.1 dTMP kinase [SAR202 cluster bacterium]|tara:strand:- start:8214 stop:8858 length:645 start_codon:yes stop_codon:yes gene_type:complete
MSILITLEGGDGSGKSTQARLLSLALIDNGYKVTLLREPGGTKLGENLREILNDSQGNHTALTDMSQLYLFLAARTQLVAERIAPVLSKPNNVIVCDRYIDSTVAYQGYGFGFDIDFIKQANYNAIGNFMPNLTILIDCPIETSIARTLSRTEDVSRFETKPNDFHQRVRSGFIELANENPDRWKIVDGTLDEKTLSQHIFTLALDVINKFDIK